jgi:hypothetical protein
MFIIRAFTLVTGHLKAIVTLLRLVIALSDIALSDIALSDIALSDIALSDIALSDIALALNNQALL